MEQGDSMQDADAEANDVLQWLEASLGDDSVLCDDLMLPKSKDVEDDIVPYKRRRTCNEDSDPSAFNGDSCQSELIFYAASTGSNRKQKDVHRTDSSTAKHRNGLCTSKMVSHPDNGTQSACDNYKNDKHIQLWEGKNPAQFLNEVSQKKGWKPPKYTEIERSGPSHSHSFRFQVELNGQLFASKHFAQTKKLARQYVANTCIKKMRLG